MARATAHQPKRVCGMTRRNNSRPVAAVAISGQRRRAKRRLPRVVSPPPKRPKTKELYSAGCSYWAAWWAVFNRERTAKGDVKGSKILIDLAHDLGFDYHKAVHGPVIAKHLDPERISDLRPLLAALLS